MHPLISSTANPKIKHVQALQKARTRKQSGTFLVEGGKEIDMAIQAGYQVEQLYWCEELDREQWCQKWLSQGISNSIVVPISKVVFEKIAYRDQKDGLVAIVHQQTHKLADLQLSKNPLLLIAEAIEKPGNLGAILRTADGVGADAVIVCDPHTDMYNPNVIRSSVGCFFNVPLVVSDNATCYAWLQDKGIATVATAITATHRYDEADLSGPIALLLGTEATGLSPFWLDKAEIQIKIPMLGVNDSLNVSVATGIVAYEALRQRGL